MMDVVEYLREQKGKMARFEEIMDATGLSEDELNVMLKRMSFVGEIMECKPGVWLLLE